jgi:hypothetical protein
LRCAKLKSSKLLRLLTTLNLLHLRVLSHRVPWTELGLAKAHCNVGVDKCHD